MPGYPAGAFEIRNIRNEYCPLCVMLNHIYSRSSTFEREMIIPANIGKGSFRRIVVGPAVDIFIHDMTLKETRTMTGWVNDSIYELAFCLGEGLQWTAGGIKKEFEIDTGESCLVSGKLVNGTCRYDSGQYFNGLSIKISSTLFQEGLLNRANVKNNQVTWLNSSSLFYKSKTTGVMKRILHDIFHCRYSQNVKRIYLEAKVLELFAVYVDEIMLENGTENVSVQLSREDVKSLQNAKKILDKEVVSPPTLRKLAKRVCLNEYKLKTGFKELFGLPVHAYVIDKRLEMARLLLEDKKMRVTEAALMVGYSDASHFAEKFRKKYGINPSEYMKREKEGVRLE
ncbi:AraC family transcriptional regulator [Candidatus Contubernalis alkaliaceticus]|uniref:AraC family transcriptional regulator n=1 Tax=Candidatus Contubernalis alkaliaceticus TaxID=338645 RepID=UPI001F4C1CE3|nr:AraC family transcriptional regulator [Candidatus Contubernalis alkalaceticus]UNC93090.1 helix-turn-helix transcriptional regulator [Candidatus Contubernalis alkalaceticus]